MAMFTDPDHLRVEDPGKIEGNMVFSYLDVLIRIKTTLQNLKHISTVALGDVKS